MKLSAQNKSFTFKSEQSGFDFRSREAKNVLELGFRDRPRNFHSTAKQFANRVGSFPILFLRRLRSEEVRIDNRIGINHLQHRQTLGRNPKSFVASAKLARPLRCNELIQ